VLFTDPLPDIAFGDFPEPALQQAENSGEGHDSSSQGRQVCDQLAPCELLDVYLQSPDGEAPARRSAGLTDRDHADVVPAGRFRLYPGEQTKVRYRLRNPSGVESATFQVFARNRQVAVWSRTLDALGAAEGEVDGELVYTGAAVPPAQPLFPGDLLTEEAGPYKLKLTLRPRHLVRCDRDVAWTYFDVRLSPTWKLVDFVPPTGMGRFGLEFDPTAEELRVVVNAYYMVVAGAWAQPPAQRMAAFKQLNEAMWSDKYRLKRGNRTWKVTFVVNNVGSGQSTEVSALEDNPKQRVDEFLARSGHLCISLRPGNGISTLIFRMTSRVANLLMTESGFDRHHPVNVSRDVLDKQLTLVAAAVNDAVTTRADPRLVSVAAAPTVGPGFTVAFANGAATLDGTAANLHELGRRIAELSQGFTLKVYVQGCRRADEAGALETQRAQAVANALQQAQVEQAAVHDVAGSEQVKVTLAYRTDAEKTAYRDQRFSYCAATHEFGHSIGLPDEYQDYSQPGPWGRTQADLQRAGAVQTAMAALIRADNVPAWPPFARHASLMSTGEVFHERYYLTVLDAFRKMIGAHDATHLDRWVVSADPGPVLAPRPLPDHGHLEAAVREGARAILRGEDVPGNVARQLGARAARGGARVLYQKVLRRGDLQPAVAFAEGDDVLLAVGAQVGREALHCVTHVRVELPKPVIDVVDKRSVAGNDVTVARKCVDDPTQRYKLVLRSTEQFTGDGTFTCATPNLAFYDKPYGGALVAGVAGGKVYTANELTAGVELHVEGAVDRAQMTLALTATAGQVSPAAAQVQLLFVALPTPKLEMYRFSVDPHEEVVPLTGPERAPNNAGAYVPATTGNPDHLKVRVKLVLHAPPGWRDKVVLRVPDANLAIFKLKTGGRPKGDRKQRPRSAQSGTPTQWREYTIDRDHFVNGQFTVWLEGKAPSNSQCDAEVQLTSTSFDHGVPRAEYDKIELTVFSLGAPVVRLPTTPAMTARDPGVAQGVSLVWPGEAQNAPPAHQDVDVVALARTLGGFYNAPLVSRAFEHNPPVVLLKGSLGAGQAVVAAAADIKPAGANFQALKLVWRFERAPDDAAAIQQGSSQCDDVPPAHVSRRLLPSAADEAKVEVPVTDHGSFHLLGKVGPSTCFVVNVVVVEATAYAGHEVPTIGGSIAAERAGILGFTANGQIVMHSGRVPFPAADPARLVALQAEVAALLAARIKLVGGGPDGKRGVDRVFGGWIQNKTGSTIVGTYHDHAANVDYTMEGEFVTNQTQGQLIQVGGGSDHYFGDAQPALATFVVNAGQPLLDTGNAHIAGRSACLGNRAFQRLGPAPPGGLGQDVVAVAVDSPGTEFFATHISQPQALLSRAQYDIAFRSFLCVWVDVTGRDVGAVSTSTAQPGELLYASVAEIAWRIHGDYTATWPAPIQQQATRDARRAADPRYFQQAVVAATTALTHQVTTAFAPHAAQPAAGRLEVRPPTPIRTFAWDAKSV
jgi:hypothetical protein